MIGVVEGKASDVDIMTDNGEDGFSGAMKTPKGLVSVDVIANPPNSKLDFLTKLTKDGKSIGEVWSSKESDGQWRSTVNITDESMRGMNVYGKVLDAIEKKYNIEFVPGELTAKEAFRFWEKRGYEKIIEVLLEYGAKADQTDIVTFLLVVFIISFFLNFQWIYKHF